MSEQPVQWEEIGRTLLVTELERAMHDIQDSFLTATIKLGDGEDLTAEDIRRMRGALEDASEAVETAAESAPDAVRAPDITRFLDDDALERYEEAATNNTDGEGS